MSPFEILCILVAYLIGAIPFGILLSKGSGIDIRKEGSKNIGATNVFRVVGKGWGIFTFTLDALKGFLPSFFFARLAGVEPVWGVLFGLMAIVGHSFPVYLKFKGGKGVATSAGMLLGVAWQAVAIGFAVWLVTVLISRYVSLASILAAAAVGGSVWFVCDKGLLVNILLTIMSILVIWLHRANIKRLMNGTENRFGKKKETAA